MQGLWTGKLVRLVAFDPEQGGALYAKWYRDSEFSRMYDYPAVNVRDVRRTRERMRKESGAPGKRGAQFLIETLAGAETIGEAELELNPPSLDEGFVSIGIGDRRNWNKGYGTEAMRLLVQYSFQEWNVHRIALSVFGYNPRAIRTYEKVGFQREGACRRLLQRGGQRFDTIFMGILRREWETIQNG